MKANIEKQKKTLKEIELDKCFRWVTLYNFGPPGLGSSFSYLSHLHLTTTNFPHFLEFISKNSNFPTV